MTFLGLPAINWLLALAYIAGGFVVGFLVAWICKNILQRIFSKTKTRVDDILLAAIEKPMVAIIVFIGLRMGIDELTIEPGVAPWISKAITILITGAVAVAVAKLFDGLTEEYLVPYVQKTEGDLDDQLLPIIRKFIAIAVWSIAALCAIREAGYDIGAILAGLGIGGVAVALAAKDTLSNFFGSVAVFVDKPFKINDRVKVAGYDGTIVEIGIRTSRLKTISDNRIVTLPNLLFTAGAIENVSSEPAAKVSNEIQLDPSVGHAGTMRALELLRTIHESVPGLEPSTIASLTGFGESSFDVTLIYFIKKQADYFGTLNAANLEVLRRLEEARIPLAFPTRVVIERKEG
jgi:Small-conductance mechanosensitive channel